MESKPLVPKLRFPEFRPTKEWENTTLKNLCDLKAGEFVLASAIAEHPVGEMYPCYGGNGLRGYVQTYTHDGDYPLLGRQGALCGNVNRVRGRFHATEHAVVATPRLSTDVVWLFYVLDFLNLNRHATGQAQPGLSVSVLNNIELTVPSLAEQKKIAECLTSLDELIEVERRKLEVLRAYKQGLMQDLFSREGETVPRLRFPEYINQDKWHEEAFGAQVRFQSGGTPSKVNADYWNGSIPWVSAKDMKKLVLDDTEDHITALAAEHGAKQVPTGTVLVLTRGMTLLKDLPICIAGRPMSFNQDVKALRPVGDLHELFLAYLLQNQKHRILQSVDIAGHGTGRLDTEKLKNLTFLLPSRKEQCRIADAFASLITAQAKRLDALKVHKQGLMQGLFP